MIPLTFSRVRAGVPVTGLSVTVNVVSLPGNATLLATRSVPETAPGSGVYSYVWEHGIVQDTECLVTYTVGGQRYFERIFIAGGFGPGRAV